MYNASEQVDFTFITSKKKKAKDIACGGIYPSMPRGSFITHTNRRYCVCVVISLHYSQLGLNAAVHCVARWGRKEGGRLASIER